jgi:hypothetical protein
VKQPASARETARKRISAGNAVPGETDCKRISVKNEVSRETDCLARTEKGNAKKIKKLWKIVS